MPHVFTIQLNGLLVVIEADIQIATAKYITHSYTTTMLIDTVCVC